MPAHRPSLPSGFHEHFLRTLLLNRSPEVGTAEDLFYFYREATTLDTMRLEPASAMRSPMTPSIHARQMGEVR
jgi:hypothetical protein